MKNRNVHCPWFKENQQQINRINKNKTNNPSPCSGSTPLKKYLHSSCLLLSTRNMRNIHISFTAMIDTHEQKHHHCQLHTYDTHFKYKEKITSPYKFVTDLPGWKRGWLLRNNSLATAQRRPRQGDRCTDRIRLSASSCRRHIHRNAVSSR